MNQPMATPSISAFMTTLRTRRMEMSLALEKARAQFGGPYVPPPEVVSADPHSNIDDVIAKADQFDKGIHDYQQGCLRQMAEMLARVDLALRLLEENGPHAEVLAYQALRGEGSPSQATMH